MSDFWAEVHRRWLDDIAGGKTIKKETENGEDNLIRYSISSGQMYDGKSVCLWRTKGAEMTKIARFQSNEAARMFAEDFNFPVSENVRKRICGGKDAYGKSKDRPADKVKTIKEDGE